MLCFSVSLDDLIDDLLESIPLDLIERLGQPPAPSSSLTAADVERLLGPATHAVVSAQEREQQLIDKHCDDVEAGRSDNGRLRDFLVQQRRAQLVQRGKWNNNLLARIECGAGWTVAAIEAEVEKRWLTRQQEIFEIAGFAPDVAAKRANDLDGHRREWRASGGPPYPAFDPTPLKLFTPPPPVLGALRRVIDFLDYQRRTGELPLQGRPHIGWPDFITGATEVIKVSSYYRMGVDAGDDHLEAQLIYAGNSRRVDPRLYVDLETTIEGAEAARAGWAALADEASGPAAPNLGIDADLPEQQLSLPIGSGIGKYKRPRAEIDDRRALLEMARLLANSQPISVHATARHCAHLSKGQSEEANVARLRRKLNDLEPKGNWQEIARRLEIELDSNKRPT